MRVRYLAKTLFVIGLVAAVGLAAAAGVYVGNATALDRNRLEDASPVTKRYQVAVLVQDHNIPPTEIVDAVETIDPYSWSDTGSNEPIRYDPDTFELVVYQFPHVHAEIEKLLRLMENLR